MHRSSLLNLLADYQKSHFIIQEEHSFLDRFVSFISEHPDCFERSCAGHITGSAWIINHEGTHALLTHHRKLKIWLQLGGHADGDADIAAVSLKEAQEESGIAHFEFLMPGIFDIDIHPIPGACQFHYDVRFVLRAGLASNLIISDESLDLAWVPFDQMEKYSNHPSITRMNTKYLKFFGKNTN